MWNRDGSGTRFRTSWRVEKGHHCSPFEMGTDSACVEIARRRQHKLRRVLQTIHSDTGFGEHMAFDTARRSVGLWPVQARDSGYYGQTGSAAVPGVTFPAEQ